MIRAYDEYGNVVDLVKWEKEIYNKALNDSRMNNFNFDTSYYFSSLDTLNRECKNYTNSEARYKELLTKWENEIYQKGLKDAFSKLECEEFDTCLRIEYEKSKAYEKALEDIREQIKKGYIV